MDEHKKLENIEFKINELNANIKRIESKLDRLLNDFEIINKLEPQCKKMSDHIDFVENVYDTVKSPMYYILNKISQIRNITDKSYKNTTNNNILLDK